MNTATSMLMTLVAAGGGDGHWNYFELISMIINFLLFFGFLAVVLKKPLGTFLVSRREEFAVKLREAEAKQAEAQAKFEEFDQKLMNLEAEVARIVKSFEAQAEADKKRIEEDTERAVERMVREVDFTIRQETLKAQADIRETAIKTTLDLAEKLVQERITDDDFTRLNQDYIKRIGDKPS